MFIRVSEALLFGAWMMGQALAYAPNVNSALDSAGRILMLLDRRPEIMDPIKKSWQEKWVRSLVILSRLKFKTYPL